MRKLAVAAAVGALALAAAALGAFVLLVMAARGVEDAQAIVAGPSETALSDIPAELLGIYRQAAAQSCAMRWAVLAAVGKVESDHRRSTLPGVHSGENAAGARGPMQFLAATWVAYGADGDGDGDRDVYDPIDAIWGAAAYLCANGAGSGRERDALWNYNHAEWYVNQALEVAAGYEAAAAVPTGDAAALAASPNLSLTPEARQDLLAGVLDQRLLDFLAWAATRHHVAVSVFKTGHSRYVAGTNRVSTHYHGRAVDIYAVDGETVTSSCGPCRSLAEEVVAMGGGRPDEMGVPWADMVGAGGSNVFSDAAHQDHLHAGWAA